MTAHDPDCGYCRLRDRLNAALNRVLPADAHDLGDDVWLIEALTVNGDHTWFIAGDQPWHTLPPSKPPPHETTGPLPAAITIQLAAVTARATR